MTPSCFSHRVTGGELFEDIVAREYYSEADARWVQSPHAVLSLFPYTLTIPPLPFPAALSNPRLVLGILAHPHPRVMGMKPKETCNLSAEPRGHLPSTPKALFRGLGPGSVGLSVWGWNGGTWAPSRRGFLWTLRQPFPQGQPSPRGMKRDRWSQRCLLVAWLLETRLRDGRCQLGR